MLQTASHVIIAFIGLSAGLATTSCGDGGSNPVEDCRTVTEKWCSESMACLVEVETLTTAEADDAADACVQQSESAASCDDAKAVTEDFPACMSALEQLDCAMFDVPVQELGSVRLPQVCEAVILR